MAGLLFCFPQFKKAVGKRGRYLPAPKVLSLHLCPKDSLSLKHIMATVVVIIIKMLVRVPWLLRNRPSYILSLNSGATLQRWLVRD